MAVLHIARPTRAPYADRIDAIVTPAHASRSLIARMLWGAAAEHCTECGIELAPRDAYRFSATEQYCSIEHAKRDRE